MKDQFSLSPQGWIELCDENEIPEESRYVVLKLFHAWGVVLCLPGEIKGESEWRVVSGERRLRRAASGEWRAMNGPRS